MATTIKTRAAVFYISTERAPDRTPLVINDGGRYRTVYVRGEVVADTVEAALDNANPRDDESVMNSHEV